MGYFFTMNNRTIKIFTIGFTNSTAEYFFGRLRSANVQKVIDTRLWPGTQLSGFAKAKDLPYFLKELSGAKYEYRKDIAPTEEILKAYKDKRISWSEYENHYINLITKRKISEIITPEETDNSCFLCACSTTLQCHRRLLVEHLQKRWTTITTEIIHL